MFRNTGGLILAVATTLWLCACASLSVPVPGDGHMIAPNRPLRVVVEGWPSLTSATVMVRGRDVSAQMSRVSSNRLEGQIPASPGMAEVEVTGEVFCWYCRGYRSTLQAKRRVCLIAPAPLPGPLKTMLPIAADGEVLVNEIGSLRTVPDPGNASSRFNFIRLGGVFSDVGMIESAQQPCHCLRSHVPLSGTQVGLSTCDVSDTSLHWQTISLGTGTNSGPRMIVRSRAPGRIIDLCMTRGTDSRRSLIQTECDISAAQQQWAVRDNTRGTFDASPW